MSDSENDENWEELENSYIIKQWPMEDFFDIVEYMEDGKIILASSNLNGRYWNGSLCILNHDALGADNYLTYLRTESGISAMKHFGNNKICIGEDSGTIYIYEFLSDLEVNHLNCLCSKMEHSDSILSVAVSPDLTTLVSASSDCSISCWNIECLTCKIKFDPAHSHVVKCVSYNSHEAELFGSSSLDGRVTLWDLRLPKPASCLLFHPYDPPTTISWQPNENFYIAFGSENGSLGLIDIRVINSPIYKKNTHKYSVSHMSFNRQRSEWLASCANDNIIYVNCIQNQMCHLLYKDQSHSDIVRGLAWSPISDYLLSVGWSREFRKHNLSNYA